ncbi:NAD(+) diphosphatase [Colwellia echini]|uniref:NAD(+) diphosphatase n=1 Tax=Colwellia echini TaxID=1982103 RepID=A0ABY3MYS7_9GAMM|nr:NAD(+) diphosphatase [Colwellia echini]TYK66329.1 NAD(+) diphosphatase [Colwellia echini]
MTFAYANMPLDRCTNQRNNKRWLAAEFNHDNTVFCVINDGMCLVDNSKVISPIYLNKAQLPTVNIASCIYLGKTSVSGDKSQSSSIFAIDFKKLRFSTQEELTELGQWQKLRGITPNLTAIDASILALAKGLVYWHTSHQFCGLCGNTSLAVEAGHARRCTDCRNMTFPRTDPAVIMLVEKMFDDGIARCLLGRQASWDKGVYSILAGFVDPGETFEQAVVREVVEETAVIAQNPQYIASQPWPFPASIMIGFTAEAISDVIDVSQDALENAQWFSREQLNSFGVKGDGLESGKDSANKLLYKMSSSDSISAYLINAWKNKEIGKY